MFAWTERQKITDSGLEFRSGAMGEGVHRNRGRNNWSADVSLKAMPKSTRYRFKNFKRFGIEGSSASLHGRNRRRNQRFRRVSVDLVDLLNEGADLAGLQPKLGHDIDF